jgi:arsenite methyltransferase
MAIESNEKIREKVREGYADIAKGKTGGCCGSSSPDALAGAIGYTKEELEALPEGANMGLSCGNPTALADLKSGQVVLDLGSGGGFDVFIAARKVGPAGGSIGVDMTPDMLRKARSSIAVFTEKTGLSNVEFRLGEIEHLPVADSSIDVVISNCVINLSPDKPQVWNEIARVLKPGGRACVSDLALKEALPKEVLTSAAALVSCVAGAVLIDETVTMAKQAGLAHIQIEEKAYQIDVMAECNDPLYRQVKEFLPAGRKLSDYVVSVNITAEKPDEESLSSKYKELIAIGASVTAHCQSCLTWHLDKARQVGANEKEMDMAVSIGKAVQKGSNAAMESFINEQRGQCVDSHESICQQKNTKTKSSCCDK